MHVPWGPATRRVLLSALHAAECRCLGNPTTTNPRSETLTPTPPSVPAPFSYRSAAADQGIGPYATLLRSAFLQLPAASFPASIRPAASHQLARSHVREVDPYVCCGASFWRLCSRSIAQFWQHRPYQAPVKSKQPPDTDLHMMSSLSSQRGRRAANRQLRTVGQRPSALLRTPAIPPSTPSAATPRSTRCSNTTTD